MAQFPGMLLWTDAWVADTHHLSRLARGTYHDLLVLMWRTPGCRVPNDDNWLAARLHMTPAEVAGELRPLIVEFCRSDGNWIVQRRLQKEFVRAYKRSERMSDLRNRWTAQQKGINTIRSTARVGYPTQERKQLTNGESQREEPPQEVAEKKKPEGMTLAEINRVRYGRENP